MITENFSALNIVKNGVPKKLPKVFIISLAFI